MFNPGELEGEVDHSFFDSDCDDDGISRDRGRKSESTPAHERLHAAQTEKTKGGLSPRTTERKQHLKQGDNNRGKVERKENGNQAKEGERYRACSVSPISSMSDKVINNSSDSEDDDNLYLKGSMALLAKGRETCNKDVYNQSSNETEEEEVLPAAKHPGPKRRNKQSPKKLIRNLRTRSPLPSLTKIGVDTDSESSSSSISGRSSSESPAPPKSSLFPGRRRARLCSAGSRDAEESDDTVTDVSPLSSPDISPLQSLDLNHTESEEGGLKEEQQQQCASVPSSGLSDRRHDEDTEQDLDECSVSSRSQLGGELFFRFPGGKNRKNYSFTNDEVRRIDRENQRLLRELSHLSPGPRPGSVAGKKTNMAGNSPLIRLSHSALNRQREQQRIERENLAFLKRLESVKPTPGLRRSEQMADYQRHVGYLGAPSYTVCGSTAKQKQKRLTSRINSAGPRSGSSVHHSSRAGSTTADPSSTSAARSKKLSVARPAWC